MSDQKNQDVPLENLVLSQVYTVQALINVLEDKGLLTRDEILRAFNEIQKIMGVNDCDCGHDHNH
jgi:hypothetical protein